MAAPAEHHSGKAGSQGSFLLQRSALPTRSVPLRSLQAWPQMADAGTSSSVLGQGSLPSPPKLSDSARFKTPSNFPLQPEPPWSLLPPDQLNFLQKTAVFIHSLYMTKPSHDIYFIYTLKTLIGQAGEGAADLSSLPPPLWKIPPPPASQKGLESPALPALPCGARWCLKALSPHLFSKPLIILSLL